MNTLVLDTGQACVNGRREGYEDACLVSALEPSSATTQGCLLAVADNSAAEQLVEPRETVVALRAGYQDAAGLELEQALRAALAHATAGARGRRPRRGPALSALVLHRGRWGVAHLGDTRVWLYRQGRLRQLTRDHALTGAFSARIAAASDLAVASEPDFLTGVVQAGDWFLLTSDGVHDALSGAIIMGCLDDDLSAQEAADLLAQRAAAAGSRDNLGVCVAKVAGLTAEAAEASPAYPAPGALPGRGDRLGGYRIEKRLYGGHRFSLYKATRPATGEWFLLKLPNPEPENTARAVHARRGEDWAHQQFASPQLPGWLPADSVEGLYSVMPYFRGESLARRIRRKHGLALDETLSLADQACAVLERLHGGGALHRGIRPETLWLDREHRRIVLIDLGDCRLPGGVDAVPMSEPSESEATYRAPELLAEGTASVGTDVYALGVTLYKMLTGHYPYGRGRVARATRFTPASRHNPALPAWVDTVLARACALEPKRRFADMAQLRAALATRGAERVPGLHSLLKWWRR